jgi:hypothetical protein
VANQGHVPDLIRGEFFQRILLAYELCEERRQSLRQSINLAGVGLTSKPARMAGNRVFDRGERRTITLIFQPVLHILVGIWKPHECRNPFYRR